MPALTLGLLAATAWLPAPPPGPPTAIAEHAQRVLLGTERGLYRESPSGWTLVLTRGGVRDLASTPAATLIATAAGLYEWTAGSTEPQALSLGVGSRVNSVAFDAAQRAWVATEAGLFVRRPGQAGFQRDVALPAAPVHAVRALGTEVWVATPRTLWRIGVAEPTLRLRRIETGWWELNAAARVGSGVVLSVPRGLWYIADGEREPRRIVLSVGELRAMTVDEERIWLASERGVYALPFTDLERGAARLALAVAARDLARSPRGLLVATRRGVALLSSAPAHAGPLGPMPGDEGAPGVRAVQRAVLAYLELSPARIAAVESRARRAAFYPRLRAKLFAERERTRDRDYDQSFSSGSVRDLFDRKAEEETSHGIDLEFVWEFSRLADPKHALDVSRERRQLVELRDQVLERVNRLYFERLRVLARLATLLPEAREERMEAELRERELSAHLDAWTGGRFSQLPSAARPQRGSAR